MDNGDNKRGFSGITGLVSDISNIDVEKSTSPKKENKARNKEKRQGSKPETRAQSTRNRPARRPQSQTNVAPPKKGNSASKVFGIMVVVIAAIIWINNYEKATKPHSKHQSSTKMYVSATALNVRTGPDGGSSRVGQLSKYDTITVLDDENIGDWAAFNFKGNISYVHSNYLKPGSGSAARNQDCRQSDVVRPKNGTILKAPHNGIHGLEVKNGSGPDALVKLKDVSGKTIFMAYIHGGAALVATNIPAGSFQFQYATGRNYSPKCGVFLDNMQANKDPKFVKYEKILAADGYYSTIVQYTLNQVSDGNLRPESISVDQF